MSGILERIEDKLDTLLENYHGVEVKNEVASAPEVKAEVNPLPTPSPLPEVTQAVEETESTGDIFAGLDANGVTWDERINAKSKKGATTAKNADGTWKKKRGLDPAEYEKVLAELKAAQSSVTEQPVSTPEIAPLPTPSAPGAPLVPSIPSAPTAPTVVKEPVISNERAEVAKLLQHLEDDKKVDPDDLFSMMESVGGADTLGKITEDKLESLRLALKTWADWLVSCTTEVNALLVVATTHGNIEGANAGLSEIYAGFDAENLVSVHPSQLSTCHDSLSAYRAAWENL